MRRDHSTYSPAIKGCFVQRSFSVYVALLRTYPRVILDLVHFKKRLLSFVHVSIIFIKAICRAIRHAALAVYCISPVHRFSFQTEWFSDFWCTCASASARQSRAQCRAREFCCKILIADRARY